MSPQKAENFVPKNETKPPRVQCVIPCPDSPRSWLPAPRSSPDSLGLQDQQGPPCVWTEPHAVDADLALRDRPRGRATCGGEERTVTACRVDGTPWSPTPVPGSRRLPGSFPPEQPLRGREDHSQIAADNLTLRQAPG